MTADDTINDIRELLATLTLGEEDFNFDFINKLLMSLETKIRDFDAQATSEHSLPIQWLDLEYLKGSMLYVGAKMNYRKQLAEGKSYPFEPATRAAIVDRFNLWSATAGLRVERFIDGRDDIQSVHEWIAELERFRADPVANL
jgi:hypothetical protein